MYQSELFVEVYTCDCNCIVELGKSILIGGYEMLILINKDTFIIEKVFIDDTNSIGRIRAILEINSDSILCGCSEGRMCLYHIKENAIDIQSKCHSKNISSFLELTPITLYQVHGIARSRYGNFNYKYIYVNII